MSKTVIEINNLGKQYRLGNVGTGTMSDDLKRFLYKLRGKEDPFLKVGESNDRTKKGSSEYVWALKDINFKVNEGEVLGIIGKNGAGKSTLLKILSRTTLPTTGEYKIKGRVASLLEVGTGFHPDLTGRENIFLNGAILGMNKAEIRKQFDAIVEFSGVERYIDTPVKRYSSGMYVRLAFAVAAHLEPEILIVDEVLAVGDAEFQKKCLGKMKDVSGQGRTVLFVSHNMAAVNNLCSRVVFLEHGQVKKEGKTEEVVNYYLKGNFQDLSFGKIPEEFPRSNYHKDILKVNSVHLKDTEGKNTDTFRYLEPLILEFELESLKMVPKPVIMAFIMHNDFGAVTYSASNDPFNNSSADIQQGLSRYKFTIEQNLLPGVYSVGIGILDDKGYPYDYITNFGQLKIENFGLSKELYPWERALGMVNTKSKIELI